MGMQRKSSGINRRAASRSAERKRCPNCGRKNAVQTSHERMTDESGKDVLVVLKVCRWIEDDKCDYREAQSLPIKP